MPNKGSAQGGPGTGRMPTISPPIFWYIIVTLIMLWIWQDAFRQVALRTIPYSEFKAHLARGEVSDCTVEEDEITGKATPKPGVHDAPAKGKGSPNAPFLFRTVRVEDPKLVEHLQKAGVKFTGVRPGILSHFLWAWLLPIAAIALLWFLLARRLGAAGKAFWALARAVPA